jgi:hypothetical protein
MSFDLSRLRRSDWITGGGAVAFFLFLFFFDWYGGSYKGPVSIGGSFGASVSSTGWDTFTNSRWIWLLTIIVALGAVVLVAGQRKLELPVRPSVLVAGLGALSTLLILYRILHHPSGGASFAGASFSYGIKFGIWLGLIAAAAVTYGGYLTMSEEGTSLSDIAHPPAGTAGGASSGAPSGSPAGAAPPATPTQGEAPPAAPTQGEAPPAAPTRQTTSMGQPLTAAGESPPLPPPSSSSAGDLDF